MPRVNLTRIYTRLGDGGETHLGDMSRVPKTHPRIEASGTVDELNAQLGLLTAEGDLPEEFRPWIERVQNDLFDLGADLAVPFVDGDGKLRVVQSQIDALEKLCDRFNEPLSTLKSFVLPGGTARSAPRSKRSFCTRSIQGRNSSGRPPLAISSPSCAFSSSTVP